MPTLGKKQTLPLKIFYSYSHNDKKWLLRLRNHLANLERLKLITTFYDREILPGDDWDRRIRQEVEDADIFLCLISEYFLASSYCNEIELKRALERHNADEALVIPIAVSHCDWEGTPFARLQAIPDPNFPIAASSRPARHLKTIAQKLHQIVKSIISGEMTNRATLPLIASSDLSRNNIPWLLPYLCDRWRQEQALFDVFDTARNNSSKPYMLILYGPREEVHDGFVERLQWDLLPHLLNWPQTQVRRLPNLDWPVFFKGYGTPQKIFTPLLAKCIDCDHFLPLSKMAELLSPAEGITLLTSTVDSDTLAQFPNQFLLQFLEFWNGWPPLPLRSHLVIILLVKFDAQSRQFKGKKSDLSILNRKISITLQDLEPNDYPGIQLCVLPALRPVPQLEVEAFVHKREVQAFCNPKRSLDMLAEITELYKRTSRFAMEKLLPELTNLLQRYAR